MPAPTAPAYGAFHCEFRTHPVALGIETRAPDAPPRHYQPGLPRPHPQQVASSPCAFLALCQRYGLKPYREHGQRQTSVMLRAPKARRAESPPGGAARSAPRASEPVSPHPAASDARASRKTRPVLDVALTKAWPPGGSVPADSRLESLLQAVVSLFTHAPSRLNPKLVRRVGSLSEGKGRDGRYGLALGLREPDVSEVQAPREPP